MEVDGGGTLNVNITYKELEPDEEGGRKEQQEFWPKIDGSC